MSRSKVLTNIESFSDLNVITESRTVKIIGEVNYRLLDKVMSTIIPLDLTDGPITMFLCSPGGDINAGLGIYDLLKSRRNLIRVIGVGEICSAASFILQAGDERLVMSNCHIMLHLGSEGFSPSHPRDIEAGVAFNKRLSNIMLNIYLEKMKIKDPSMTLSKVEKMITFDKFLNCQEALNLGLIDGIVSSRG